MLFGVLNEESKMQKLSSTFGLLILFLILNTRDLLSFYFKIECWQVQVTEISLKSITDQLKVRH